MNCRVALRLIGSQTLVARANPARSITLVPSVQNNVRFIVTDKQSKHQKKKKVADKKKVDENETEIEEAEENALSAKDETEPPKVLSQLRHQHKNPIPVSNQSNEITEHDDKQREVIRRQEQMRAKKQDILKRVKTLATMEPGELAQHETYTSIEEAYKSLKYEFEGALLDRKPDELYDVMTSMRSMGLRLPKKSYDAAAILFAEEQHIYKVRDVWEFMQRDEIFPDQESFMNIVTIYCHMTQYEWAMRSFFKMCEYLCPTPEAYEQILELFSKNSHIGNLRKAERLFDQCTEVFHTIHRFDVKHTPKACASFIRLLCASGYEGDGDRAVDVLKYMKQKVIGPVPDEVPKYFIDHLKKYVIPERQFIRTKKILRGCQHGGLPDEPFKGLWETVESKSYVQKIHRADLAAPLDKMDLTRPQTNPEMRLG